MKKYSIYWACLFLVPFFWPGLQTAQVAEDLLALAMALFAAGIMWEGRGRSFSETWAWMFVILILVPVFIHFVAADLRSPWLAWRDTTYIVSSWVVFMMARDQGRAVLGSSTFAWVLTVTAYSFIAYALIQAYDIRFFTHDVRDRLFPVWSNSVARFPGPIQQANFQGLFLSLVVCSQVFQSMLRPEKLRMWIALAIIPFTGILLTSSRSSLLAVGLGMACLFFIAQRRKTYLIGVACFVLLGIILSQVILATVPATVTEMGPNMLNRFESGGYMTRLLIWDMSIQIALKHAILGIGWGNLSAYGIDGMIEAVRHYPSLTSAMAILEGEVNMWAHNLLLQGWVEGGIPGLLAVFMMYVAILIKWRRFYSNAAFPLDGQTLGLIFATLILFHGLISVSVMQPYFMSILALSMASAFPRDDLQADMI